jgi:hypothetical protein
VAVAKNYLTEEELGRLNRLVSSYLDFAEQQAQDRKPMYMSAWIAKLDDFIRLFERGVLNHAGSIKHEEALARAEAEYKRFASERAELPSPVEAHFEEAIREVKRVETRRKAGPPKGKGKKA